MSTALSESEIAKGLAALDGWAREGDSLVKTFAFDSYLAGLAFASAVGVISEGLNHHPDLSIGWRRVAVSYTTHDAGNQLSCERFCRRRRHRRTGLSQMTEAA